MLEGVEREDFGYAAADTSSKSSSWGGAVSSSAHWSISAAAAEHSITIRSASKAWNIAGLKCAQVIATNHADAALWRTLPVFKVAHPTPLGIVASTAAYVSGGPWLRELTNYLDGNRRFLGKLLAVEIPEIEYRASEGTFLTWLDCRGARDR